MDSTAGFRTSSAAGAAGHRSLYSSSLMRNETVNCRSTQIINGQLVAKPYATSDKPFTRVYPSSIAYGKHDPVLNPPNRDRTTSYRRDYNPKTNTVQTAGTIAKLPATYNPNAARNRIKVEFKRDPPPFSSQLELKAGVLDSNLHPYRTISAVTQAPTRVPMHTRLGFTNTAITSELTKRLHKPVFK